MDKSISLETNDKKMQQLTKTADMIRSAMNFKNVKTFFMRDLVKTLNDN